MMSTEFWHFFVQTEVVIIWNLIVVFPIKNVFFNNIVDLILYF